MSNGFEGIIAQLKEEQIRLSSRKEELTAQLRDVEAEIKRAQAALAALGAKPATKKAAGRKLNATRQQIASHAADVLRDLGTLELDALHREVEARVKKQGLSCVGFDARFKEALGEECFNESPAGWKLVADDVSESGDAHAEALT